MDAKYLKTCIKLLLFYSLFQKKNNYVQQDLFQSNSQKKLLGKW